MARWSILHILGTKARVIPGAALAGLLACSTPALDHWSVPLEVASSPPAAVSATPSTPALLAPSAPPAESAAAPPPIESAAAPPPAASAEVKVEPSPGAPRRRSSTESPATARGTCSGWTTLETKRGEVDCYPYRCRAGRCLSSCKTREDCAGSLGPGDMAEHGWPLDCAPSSATCYPLSPQHVHGR